MLASRCPSKPCTARMPQPSSSHKVASEFRSVNPVVTRPPAYHLCGAHHAQRQALMHRVTSHPQGCPRALVHPPRLGAPRAHQQPAPVMGTGGRDGIRPAGRHAHRPAHLAQGSAADYRCVTNGTIADSTRRPRRGTRLPRSGHGLAAGRDQPHAQHAPPALAGDATGAAPARAHRDRTLGCARSGLRADPRLMHPCLRLCRHRFDPRVIP
jgi:hypothetical protein